MDTWRSYTMKWLLLIVVLVYSLPLPAQIPSVLSVDVGEHYTDEEHYSASCKHSAMLQGAISTPTQYIAQSFDVLHYELKLGIPEPPKAVLNGDCEITFRWVATPDAFVFHLRGLTVDSVFYNGQPVNTTNPEPLSSPTYHYRVEAASGAKLGDTVKLRVLYHGTATGEGGSFNWGGVQTDGKSVYALGVGFNNNYVSATQHWMPCYDHPSDKATFRGDFATVYPYVVASNGLLEVVPGNATSHYIWTMKDPAATYLMTFACDTYERLQMSGASKPIELWARAADTTNTKKSFKLLPRMVSTFERLFSPYPFEKVGYCNTLQGSMEHQSMICFAASISRSGDTINTTGAHELAHQWFGDFVTPYDFRDAWLNEGFATYCESLWMEELRGNNGYINSIQGDISNYFTYAGSEGVVSMYDFDRKPPSSNYPRAIYEKGSVVLGMLRYLMGDANFFAAIREYLERYGYANATTDSLQAIVSAHADASVKAFIKPFFDEWIRGKGWARIEVQTLKQHAKGAWQSVMTINQIQSADYPVFTVLPIEFSFKDKQGNFIHKTVLITQKTQTVTIDSVNDYTEVSINRGSTVRTLLQMPKLPTITSVENPVWQSQRLAVYPNPAESFLWVELPSLFAEMKLQVFSALGEKVLEQTIHTHASSLFPLYLNSLTNGQFTLVLKSDSGLYATPFVIAR